MAFTSTIKENEEASHGGWNELNPGGITSTLNGVGQLHEIRDRSTVSTRNTSKGALLKETYAVFSAVRTGLPLTKVREAILNGEVLKKTAFETRRKIWNALKHRYLSVCPDWIGSSLAIATKEGSQSPEYLSLAYLYFAIRDRLVFDFVTGPVWDNWQRQSTSLNRGDYLAFLDQQADNSSEIKKWHESSRKKLAGNTLSSLRDFGLLRGTQKKQIRRMTVAPETVFHLLTLLNAEGLEGRAILQAQDWRLFLWSETEVLNALGELAQMNWVRFEKSGRTVILQLIRVPEVSYER